MNYYTYAVPFLVLLWLGELHGCHDRGHGGGGGPGRRTKRQTDTQEPEEDYTVYLRDFFTECLRSKVGDIWEWGSVVDVSVLDSQWYRNSDVSNCSMENGGDSVFCWQLRLNEYLKQSSPLLQETSVCINEYNTNVTNSAIVSRPRQRSKRQAGSQGTTPAERCTDYHPNSPEVRAYGSCNTDNIDLSPSRREIDFSSVTEFIAENTICGSEFADCGANQEETISQGDPSVPSWPYRFEALMRRDTPVRNSVLTCNNMIYPIKSTDADPERRCSDWQNWGTCSCNGCSGTKTRTRSCPTGSGVEAEQQLTCNSECTPSPARNNFLCNYFSWLFLLSGQGGNLGGGGASNFSDVLPLLTAVCQGTQSSSSSSCAG